MDLEARLGRALRDGDRKDREATAPKERPILFSAPMVRALLAGTKTQTRRIFKGDVQPHLVVAGALCGALCAALKPNDSRYDWWVNCQPEHPNHISKACPYGKPGERLWVRETWCPLNGDHSPAPRSTKLPANGRGVIPAYRADHDDPVGDAGPLEWRPSIFMPRWASRITLEVTEVRFQRLQDITEEDAKAEGVGPAPFCKAGRPTGQEHVESFEDLWCEINGTDSWASNPWVWCVSFKRVRHG
jgi:hypothetical protein